MSRICFFFSLILVSALTSNSFASEKFYTIQGKIISNLSEKELTNIPVVLLKFDASIQDAPPMIPIQKSQTNEKGEYYFAGVKKEAEIEYLIGALIQGNRISSNRIQLKENQQEILNLDCLYSLEDHIQNKDWILRWVLYRLARQNSLLK